MIGGLYRRIEGVEPNFEENLVSQSTCFRFKSHLHFPPLQQDWVGEEEAEEVTHRLKAFRGQFAAFSPFPIVQTFDLSPVRLGVQLLG